MNLAETQQLFWDLLEGSERTLDAFVGSPALPASALRRHPACTILADAEARPG